MALLPYRALLEAQDIFGLDFDPKEFDRYGGEGIGLDDDYEDEELEDEEEGYTVGFEGNATVLITGSFWDGSIPCTPSCSCLMRNWVTVNQSGEVDDDTFISARPKPASMIFMSRMNWRWATSQTWTKTFDSQTYRRDSRYSR